MRLYARLNRYVTAWAHLDEIHQLTRDHHALEAIVDRAFDYAHGFFEPIQIRAEILGALRMVEEARPRYIVEIGTAAGGTLLLWSRVAHPEATIVTIDLPGGRFGGGSSVLRPPLLRRLPLPGQTCHILRMDSHASQTVQKTRQLLGGNPVDFLFIDGDHTEAGVRADYAHYSRLVRSGGLIGLHDIAVTQSEYGVRALWAELAGRHEHREFRAPERAWGIGILTQP